MKYFIIVLFALSVSTRAFSQEGLATDTLEEVSSHIEKTDSSIPKKLPLYIPENMFEQFLLGGWNMDSGKMDIHHYDRTQEYLFSSNLGNNASPAFSLTIPKDYHEISGFNSGWEHWNPYRVMSGDMNYYNARNPFFDFRYIQSFLNPNKKDVLQFHALHTQNIKPNWNYSILANNYTSEGIYDNQKATQRNIGFNTWYYSPNLRYLIMAHTLWNQFSFVENGGIKDDSFFIAKTTPDALRASADVNLYEAEQKWKDRSFYVRQFYFLGKHDSIRLPNDSLKRNMLKPRFYISQSTDYVREQMHYKDSSKNQETFYPTTYLYMNKTDEIFLTDKLTNEVSFGNPGFYLLKDTTGLFPFTKFKFKLTLGDEFIHVKQLHKDSSFNNLYSGAELNLPLGASFQFRQYLSGYNAGDRFFKMKVYKNLSHQNNTFAIVFRYSNESTSPDWKQQFMYANHSRWEHNFEHVGKQNLSVSLNKGENFFSTIRYITIKNYIYFDSSGVPIQRHGREGESITIKYAGFFLEHKLHLGKHFTFDNNILFQKVLNYEQFLHLPDFAFKTSWYYSWVYFHSPLTLNIGIDIRYNSSCYADLWMPGLSEFVLQDKILIGNYPFVDAFISGTVKSFRFFALLEHINSSVSGYNYFVSPHQPAYPLTGRFGVRWMFFN